MCCRCDQRSYDDWCRSTFRRTVHRIVWKKITTGRHVNVSKRKIAFASRFFFSKYAQRRSYVSDDEGRFSCCRVATSLAMEFNIWATRPRKNVFIPSNSIRLYTIHILWIAAVMRRPFPIVRYCVVGRYITKPQSRTKCVITRRLPINRRFFFFKQVFFSIDTIRLAKTNVFAFKYFWRGSDISGTMITYELHADEFMIAIISQGK